MHGTLKIILVEEERWYIIQERGIDASPEASDQTRPPLLERVVASEELLLVQRLTPRVSPGVKEAAINRGVTQRNWPRALRAKSLNSRSKGDARGTSIPGNIFQTHGHCCLTQHFTSYTRSIYRRNEKIVISFSFSSSSSFQKCRRSRLSFKKLERERNNSERFIFIAV